MGGGLRKSAPSSYTIKSAFASTGPSHSATVVPGTAAKDAALALEAQLDREEELEAQK